METIDGRRALELLIDVVDQYGPETVYEKVPLPDGDGNGCVYVYLGEPSCLVGHALVRAGAPISGLNISSPAALLDSHFPSIGSAAARVFQAAQDKQDTGETWGDALDAAREEYERLTGARK